MSESNHSTNPPSATRFNMKSLMVLMVAVAIVSTLAGLHVRSVDERAQWHLTAYWISFLTCLLLLFVIQTVLRAIAEKKAGRVLSTVPCRMTEPKSLLGSKTLTALWSLMVLCMLWIFLNNAIERALDGKPIIRVLPDALVPAMFIGVTVRDWWWQKEVWLCQQGFVWKVRFFPWTRVDCWYFAGEKSEIINLRYSERRLTVNLEFSDIGAQTKELVEFLSNAIGPALLEPPEDTRPVKAVWMGLIIREDPPRKPKGKETANQLPAEPVDDESAAESSSDCAT